MPTSRAIEGRIPFPVEFCFHPERDQVGSAATDDVRNIVYFDLETMRAADEVGGWKHIDKMGMSIGVTYSTGNGEYSIYQESEVNDLIEELQRADLVVGFNHIRFDYEVLHGYTPLDLRQLPSLDLMVDLQQKLSHRLKLDSIANATFGAEKIADGLQALKWYKQGKILAVSYTHLTLPTKA